MKVTDSEYIFAWIALTLDLDNNELRHQVKMWKRRAGLTFVWGCLASYLAFLSGYSLARKIA